MARLAAWARVMALSSVLGLCALSAVARSGAAGEAECGGGTCAASASPDTSSLLQTPARAHAFAASVSRRATSGAGPYIIKKHDTAWGTDNSHGSPFDDYQFDGYAGAISKVCYWKGKANTFTWQSIIGFRAYYAGKEGRYHGGIDQDSSACFQLNPNEVIYHITGKWSDGENGLMALQFCTRDADSPNWRRCSERIGEDNKGGETFSWVAPAGMHIMSFWGAASGDWFGWDGNIEKIGVYYGYGGGSAGWEVADATDGTSAGVEYEYEACSTKEQSSSVEDTSEWSVSVTTEMSAGFELKGVPIDASVSMESSVSHTLVTSHSSSFTFSNCRTKTFTCPKNHRLWVWTYHSSFGGQRVETQSGTSICSQTRPCCMPGTYLGGSPNVCNLTKNAPNLCSPRVLYAAPRAVAPSEPERLEEPQEQEESEPQKKPESHEAPTRRRLRKKLQRLRRLKNKAGKYKGSR